MVYFILLVIAEIAASLLVAWGTKDPGHIMATTVLSAALLWALTILNSEAVFLSLGIIGFCSLGVIVQLFTANPRQNDQR
jgi:hypothetical protein